MFKFIFLFFQSFTQFTIGYGSPNRTSQIAVVANVVNVHPNYNAATRENDIAVITLNQPVAFNINVRALRLPSLGSPVLPLENEQGYIVGHGPASHQSGAAQERLQGAYQRIVSHQRCLQSYPASNAVQNFCGEDERLRSNIW